MKNIDRISRYITKNGENGILIHTYPGTRNWIVCQKMKKDSWTVTLCDPMGETVQNIGNVTNREHLQLWAELIKMEIEIKTSQIELAKEMRSKMPKQKSNVQ